LRRQPGNHAQSRYRVMADVGWRVAFCGGLASKRSNISPQ
jgi:hypothetical protein